MSKLRKKLGKIWKSVAKPSNDQKGLFEYFSWRIYFCLLVKSQILSKSINSWIQFAHACHFQCEPSSVLPCSRAHIRTTSQPQLSNNFRVNKRLINLFVTTYAIFNSKSWIGLNSSGTCDELRFRLILLDLMAPEAFPWFHSASIRINAFHGISDAGDGEAHDEAAKAWPKGSSRCGLGGNIWGSLII